MAVQITIIGTGKIGGSIGLALANHTEKLYRVGHDIRPEVARHAQKLGAIDKVAYNLPGSVADADIVLLALPLDQIRDTLKHIIHDLKEGAVIMDTSPVKTAVAAWIRELVPNGRYYVGLTPVVQIKYAMSEIHGLECARPDLFYETQMGIVAPQGTIGAALKLATDITHLLGAKPLYFDMVEVDSLMAATHIVPQLMSAGLLGATTTQPGWDSGRKIAGSAFAHIASAVSLVDSPATIAHNAVLSKAHVQRILDNVIRELVDLKAYLDDDDMEPLVKHLTVRLDALNAWMTQRGSGEWEEGPPTTDMPTSGEEMRRWVLGRRKDQNR